MARSGKNHSVSLLRLRSVIKTKLEERLMKRVIALLLMLSLLAVMFVGCAKMDGTTKEDTTPAQTADQTTDTSDNTEKTE